MDSKVDYNEESPPWMQERVFGGRMMISKSGLFYCYDVLICAIPDAIVDCLADIIPRINSTWGPKAYEEMRHHFYDGNGSKLSFVLQQLAARFLGCELTTILIQGISNAIRNLAG